MDAEQVVEKILSDARAESEKILSEAKQRCDGAQAKLDAELAEYKAESATLAAAAAEEKKSRMAAGARMQIRKENLAAKGVLLDEVFDKAKGRINAMGDDDYRKFISELMARAVETGDEEVIVGRNETRIDHKTIKEINRQLGPGFRGNLQLSEKRADIVSGFILRRGKVQINVSTGVLMSQARDELDMELAEILFGGERSEQSQEVSQ